MTTSASGPVSEPVRRYQRLVSGAQTGFAAGRLRGAAPAGGARKRRDGLHDRSDTSGLLQGWRGPRAGAQIIDRFADIAMIVPTRGDHIDAAHLRNECRRHGIQVGTIDALLTQLCIGHKLAMLSTDRDFSHIADCTSLRLWCAL